MTLTWARFFKDCQRVQVENSMGMWHGKWFASIGPESVWKSGYVWNVMNLVEVSLSIWSYKLFDFLPQLMLLWDKFYLYSYFFQIVYDAIEYDRIKKKILKNSCKTYIFICNGEKIFKNSILYPYQFILHQIFLHKFLLLVLDFIIENNNILEIVF